MVMCQRVRNQAEPCARDQDRRTAWWPYRYAISLDWASHLMPVQVDETSREEELRRRVQGSVPFPQLLVLASLQFAPPVAKKKWQSTLQSPEREAQLAVSTKLQLDAATGPTSTPRRSTPRTPIATGTARCWQQRGSRKMALATLNSY